MREKDCIFAAKYAGVPEDEGYLTRAEMIPFVPDADNADAGSRTLHNICLMSPNAVYARYSGLFL